MSNTRALTIAMSTHVFMLAFLLLALKQQLIQKAPRQPPHQAPVRIQKSKSNIPLPPATPSAAAPQIPPAPQISPPAQTPPVPTQVPYIPQPTAIPHKTAKPQPRGTIPVATENITTPAPEPLPQNKSNKAKRMHAWKRAAQTQTHPPEPVQQQLTRTQVAQQLLHARPSASSIPTKKSESHSEASRAHAAAARFHNDFARKKIEDYIYNIVYTVGCTYNSNPLLLTPDDVPCDLSFIITLDKNGQLLSITTDRTCPTARGEQWRNHVIACFYKAAPFRTTPSEAPDPWTIPLRTDFEHEFLQDTSPRPRPVMFRLTRSPY